MPLIETSSNKHQLGRKMGHVTHDIVFLCTKFESSSFSHSCTKEDYIKSGQRDDKSPLKGVWFCSREWRDPFFLPNCGLRKNFATARC